MRKSIFLVLLSAFAYSVSVAQAVLPTTWSFTTTTLPVGWTESGTAFYTASGNTPPAMKFDNTGDYMIINFASAPGALTYYLAGNSFSGGTFTVEESANGTTYTSLHAHTAPPAGVYQMYTDVPNSLTRFIRFIYTNKVSGNIGLDDVNIAVGAATPAQEINVKYAGTTIVSGGTQTVSSPVATMTPFAFTVENLGTTNTLNISSAVISGANAADFSVASFPSTVAATANQSLTVNFTPAMAGTRTAVLTINSDDSDEAAYVINLNGIGGNFATEPASQPTNLVFSNVKSYRITGSFTSTTADGYLVLRKKGSAITGTPVDGAVYQRGDMVGDGQVVYSGAGTTFLPNNIVASTGYYFVVYAYNGAGTYRNYLTTAPLAGNVTSSGSMQPVGYYSTISTSSPTFVSDLHNLVNPHQMQFYSNYGALMVAKFAARDTTLDRRVITCVYSGENKIYTEPFDFTATGYSREHTYCHSWMPTNPADALPEYNDYHHLFPTNQNNANALRSNYPLGKVVNQTSTYLGCKFGTDANGHQVFEPRDIHKGDAARAMMYEAICYTTVSGNNWGFPNPISGSIPYGQDQAILKQWNLQDMPDAWEISRNDYIDSLQDNRNPFVDNPNYACFVNFTNMSYESLGCTADVEEALLNGFILYPNPVTNVLVMNVDATTITGYQIIATDGKVVKSADGINQVLVELNIQDLKVGSYIVKVRTPYGEAQKTIVKN
ncbi:endonuclease [Fluviicola taffensis]|uniref:endonuclease n=1 Tax=Fluviicola taffensis TaxID=191579 RepID=UPI003137FADB